MRGCISHLKCKRQVGVRMQVIEMTGTGEGTGPGRENGRPKITKSIGDVVLLPQRREGGRRIGGGILPHDLAREIGRRILKNKGDD